MDMFKRKKDKSPKPGKSRSPDRRDVDGSVEREDERSSSMTDRFTGYVKSKYQPSDKEGAREIDAKEDCGKLERETSLTERFGGLMKSKPKSRSPEKVDEVEEFKEDEKKEESSMSGKVTTFMKPYLKDARTWTAKEASDAKKELQKAAGLGHQPDVVPKGEASINGEPRTVELGWHPVAGATGKWFAEKTIIGKQITERVGKYPDPTQHWAVIVGDYVHQLWMDGDLNIIYINEHFKREDWHKFVVGKTRFNDQALNTASRMTIHNMRTARPAYNLISNNCQNFAVELLKAVQVGGHREFGTTFAVYQRATGEGAIMDLFADKPDMDPERLQQDEIDAQSMGKLGRVDTAALGMQVMQDNTTQLDDHDEGGDGRGGRW